METLKFLMISTHFPPQQLGGDAVFVEYLSKELIRRGHEVHVFYSPAAFELLRDIDSVPPMSGDDHGPTRHPFRSALGRMDPLMALSLGMWGRAKRALVRLEGELNPDVVHWHNPRGFIGRPFPFQNAASLYTTHDYTLVCPRSNLLKPDLSVCNDPRWCTICCMRRKKPPQLWRMGTHRVLRFDSALKVVSPSEFMANRIRNEGVPVHRVLRGFVPDIGKTYMREGTGDDTIVYLGLLEQHKGIQTLVDAFAKTRDKQGFKLVIIGEGTLRERLMARISRDGLSARVFTPGFLSRDAAEGIRKEAVAQIVPSVWYENAPSTILEAFSLGVPVVASDIGGLPEMVSPDAGSATFKAGDANQLAELLLQLWQDRSNLEDKRRMARSAYESRFTSEIHVTEYLRMIANLREGG